MSTHNIGFNEDLTKIIFELSSNMHLISFAESVKLFKSFKKNKIKNPVTILKIVTFSEKGGN